MFKRAGLAHNVLNAKYHQREAEIVAGAGQPGAITIATNMAGRGTDIKLGPGVTPSKPSQIKDLDGKLVDVDEIGGLHIIGSERHESRRIDRQLRGRAGRQGDPGASQFFLSLEDDLMRLFGSDRIARLMDRMGAEEGEVLTHPLITRSIEQAQKRVELQNFQARKRLLEYDDVMNQQREVIYSLRSFALEGGEELSGEAVKMVDKARREARRPTLLAEFEDDDGVGLRAAPAGTADALPADRCRSSRGDDPPTTLEGVVAGRGRGGAQGVRGEGAGAGRGSRRAGAGLQLPAALARHAQRAGREVEGSPLRPRPAARRDSLPVVGPEGPAHRVQAGSVHDVRGPHERHPHTFTERFLRVQLVFNAPPPPPPALGPDGDGGRRPTRRYNALGVLEDIPAEEPVAEAPRAATPHADGDGAPKPTEAPARPAQSRDRTRRLLARVARASSRISREAREPLEVRSAVALAELGCHRLVERRPQRSVPVWIGEEVQEVPWSLDREM